MPESIKMALLRNAVKDIPQLSIVETLDEYTSTTSGAGSSTQLTYTSYYNLLINACIRYDVTNTSTPSKRRNVHTAARAQDLKISMLLKNPLKHTSIMTLTQHQMTSIRYTKRNKASHHIHPCLDFREITPESQPPLQPKNLSKNMMALYMSRIHVTDITDHESAPPEDTTHEEQPDPHSFGDTPTNEFDPILDYINSQHHQEEDMNHALQAYIVMATPTPNDTPQRSINLVHIHLLYHVAKAKQVQHGSLVDRGANGCLAGSDVRILSKSSRKCTVTGIDQHHINGLDIVQCATLAYTNHGYVNLIMNEYAYYGKGHTITLQAKLNGIRIW